MLDLAIVDKFNRAGFVVAPYSTPEEVPSVKSVSGPARHVGEAGKHGSTQSTCRGTRDLIVRRSRLCGGRGGGGQRGESIGHEQNLVLTYRYQVERCAGPVEVQRARK